MRVQIAESAVVRVNMTKRRDPPTRCAHAVSRYLDRGSASNVSIRCNDSFSFWGTAEMKMETGKGRECFGHDGCK